MLASDASLNRVGAGNPCENRSHARVNFLRRHAPFLLDNPHGLTRVIPDSQITAARMTNVASHNLTTVMREIFTTQRRVESPASLSHLTRPVRMPREHCFNAVLSRPAGQCGFPVERVSVHTPHLVSFKRVINERVNLVLWHFPVIFGNIVGTFPHRNSPDVPRSDLTR